MILNVHTHTGYFALADAFIDEQLRQSESVDSLGGLDGTLSRVARARPKRSTKPQAATARISAESRPEGHGQEPMSAMLVSTKKSEPVGCRSAKKM